MAYLQRSGYWGKGHLCMSSERGGANQQINMQTFYPTNIAPQPSAKAGTFGTVWGLSLIHIFVFCRLPVCLFC